MNTFEGRAIGFRVYLYICGFFLFWVLGSSTAHSLQASIADHTHKNSLRILIFGDSGTGLENQYLVAEAMTQVCLLRQCDFALLLGDNFYPEGVTSVDDPKFNTHFEIPYGPLAILPGFQIFTVFGNHDRKGSASAQINYKSPQNLWVFPSPFYKMPNLPDWLKIVNLDTEILTETNPLTRRFSKKFKRQLKYQKRLLRSEMCGFNGWRVVVGHHPLFTTGKEKNKDEEAALRDSILSSIEGCEVDFYLSGHEHFQEHVTYKDLDAIIQGSASQLRYKTSPIPVEGAKSVFKAIELGFAVLEIDSKLASMTFYNSNAEAIYQIEKQKQLTKRGK